MELKGSKTEQNLMKAFAGESQARNKYTYFASKAKKDGYEQIAALFAEVLLGLAGGDHSQDRQTGLLGPLVSPTGSRTGRC